MATSSIPSRVWITALLAILTLRGGYLRLEDLSRESYWMDEAFSVNAIKAIQETGEPLLASGARYECPVYCYPSALIADALGDAPASYRLLAAIAGTAFIPIFFLIVRRMFGSLVSLGATALLAASSIHIAWSRDARWYTLFELFFWLSLWAFWECMRARKKGRREMLLWGIATLAATALAILTHALGWLLPLIFAAWCALDRYVVTKAGSLKEAMLVFGLATAGVLIALLSSHALPAYLERFAFYNTLIFYVTYLIGTYAILLVAGVLGVVLTTSHDKRPLWFLVFAALLYLIPLALFNPVIHYRYLFHLVPVIFIAAAFGVSVLFEQVRDRIACTAVLGVVAVVFITTGAGVLAREPFYPLETDEGIWLPGRTYSAATPEPDWAAAYAYIEKSRSEGDVVISSLPVMTKIYLDLPGYWLPYSYLGLPSAADALHAGKESYVGADAIESLEELELLMREEHGFIVFDRMAAAKRVDAELLAYVDTNARLVFTDKRASYSEIWVYAF